MADVRALLRQQRAARGLDQTTGRHSDAQLRKQKRKHVEDVDMDVDVLEDGGASRHKRSRPASDLAASDQRGAPQTPASEKANSDADKDGPKRTSKEAKPPTAAATPQVAHHRTNGTPVHGIEINIPSRPATPNTPKDAMGGSSNSSGGLSTASTPKTLPIGRSPLVPQEATMPTTSVAGVVVSEPPSATETKAASPPPPAPAAAQQAAKVDINEDEWALFEAEVVNAPAPPGEAAAAAVDAKSAINGGGAISAPPVAADGGSREEQDARRRTKEANAVEDEKEEAKRALETEFEEMEELEARVKKLKEKREALRHAPPRPTAAAESTRVENAQQGPEAEVAADEEDDDDDDDASDDDDDWDGFRFKA